MFRILIIDDTKSVHAYVKSLLAKLKDIEVVDVFDGVEAIAHLKADCEFDLILLDWEMPNLNGPDTLEEIKKMGIDVPVMMMTTKNSAADIARMLGAGASEYLMKPFTIDILVEKIEFACGRAVNYAA